jgi:hypothetical protein
MPRALAPLTVAFGLAVAAMGAAAAAATAPAAPPCPPPPTRLLERAIAADCLSCWQAMDDAPSRTLVLDWIVPSADEGDLSVAALPEAAERFPDARTRARREQPLATPKGTRLEVSSGLAWNGYVGLSFVLRAPPKAPWPADAAGYVALVERIPAGTDGSTSARQLVRAVAGPLNLQPPRGKAPLQHLVAVRLPANGEPGRFGAVGWVDSGSGAERHTWLAAESAPAGCRAPKRR